jgi:hypothetical protein
MAQEKRSMGEDRVQEALDLCLARMRRGESPERCLVDFADLTEELRPLLLIARDLRASRDASIPAPPAGMMAGRERFLDAARRMRADERAAASEPELADALDTCLTRIAAGEPVERVLTAYPAALAAAMRPLVDTSVALAATPAAPPPPGGLAAGRARFLATAGLTAGGVAAAAKLNGKNGHAAYPGAEQSESDPAITEALDACLARIRAGERSDIVLAAFPAALADQLRPLVAAAGELMDGALPAPPAPGGLAAGRARFLDIAARSEAHHAAVVGARQQAALTSAAVARVTFRDRIGAWMPGLMLRASSAAMLAVVLFFGGVLMVRDNAAIAGALPGEPAYLIKRLNEQIDLLTTFDPVRRGQIEQAQDEQRAAEVDQLLTLGREADVSLRAAFLGYEIEQLADGSTRILLRLRVPPTGDGAGERVIVLGDGAALDLGGYARIEDLPAGAVIGLTLRTGSESGARALARSVQLVALPPATAGASVPPSAPAAPTLVLRVAEPRADLRTVTVQPIVPATSSAVLPLQPGTATATDLPPPPTATAMPTVEVTVAASAAPSRDVKSQKVDGVVIEQPAADVWLVATDGCTAQRVVRVDISQMTPNFLGVSVLFNVVHVSGKFQNSEKTVFTAAKLRGDPEVGNVTESEEIGTVLALPGDGTLTLQENGRSYRFDPTTVVGELKVGAKVTVRYQSCGGGTPVALAVNVHAAAVEMWFEGQVADLVPNVSFTLMVTDDGDPSTPDRVTVQYDATTPIFGIASSLTNGQLVEVRGVLEGDVMRPTGITVIQDPPPLIGEPGNPPPVATFAPTPAPTSETNTQ